MTKHRQQDDSAGQDAKTDETPAPGVTVVEGATPGTTLGEPAPGIGETTDPGVTVQIKPAE